eukprot:jgi/Astpho2/4680/Aster-00241
MDQTLCNMRLQHTAACQGRLVRLRLPGQCSSRRGDRLSRAARSRHLLPCTATAEPVVEVDDARMAVTDLHHKEADQGDLAAAEQKTQAAAQQPSQHGDGDRRRTLNRTRTRGNRTATVPDDAVIPDSEWEGTVVSVMAYGAFVNIGAKTDGLVHISQLG